MKTKNKNSTLPTIEQIRNWLIELGYDNEIPDDPHQGMKLLRSVQRNFDPSSKQLTFLKSLGYSGKPPKTMRNAAELIEKLKRKSVHQLPDTRDRLMAGKPVTEKQIELLDSLGYDFSNVEDRAHASRIIDALLSGANPDKVDEYLQVSGKFVSVFENEEDLDVAGTIHYVYSIDKLKSIRKRIHKSLPKIKLNSLAEGWSNFEGDWNVLFDSLKHIKIKKGFTLNAYIFRSGGNSNGCVFGIPVNCKKEPIKIHRTEYSQTRIKLPPFTLGRVVGDPDDPWGGPVLPKSGISHYMTLFTGDHSPKSYMEAAILMHELSDFAANWHGVYWDDVKLLGQKKFLEICKKAKEEKMDYDFLIGSQQMFSPKTNPTVIVKPDKVIFRFLAYCPLRPERIYFARHIFAEDSMELQYDQDVIAYGQGGIVH